MPEEVSLDISPLALSILELLNEQPMHPYELAGTMRSRHHDEFIRLNFGSLYHTVDSLQRYGWIVPAEREKEGGRPERTIYRLTDSGRQVLQHVIGEIVAQPRREYLHFSAGLMFMHNLTAADAAQKLEQRAQRLQDVLAKLSHIHAELLQSGRERLWIIELEHKIALLEAERAWVRKTVKEISDGKQEWKGAAGINAGAGKLRRRNGSSEK